MIDNAPCHASPEELTSDDGNIITMFLPPNCTPLIQPMDQNPIRLIKISYKKTLLTHIVSEKNEIGDFLKKTYNKGYNH